MKKDDPGYHCLAHKCKIYLDGEFVNNCFTADEEEGEVFVYKKGEDDQFVLDKNRELVVERKTGVVRLVVPAGMKRRPLTSLRYAGGLVPDIR